MVRGISTYIKWQRSPHTPGPTHQRSTVGIYQWAQNTVGIYQLAQNIQMEQVDYYGGSTIGQTPPRMTPFTKKNYKIMIELLVYLFFTKLPQLIISRKLETLYSQTLHIIDSAPLQTASLDNVTHRIFSIMPLRCFYVLIGCLKPLFFSQVCIFSS